MKTIEQIVEENRAAKAAEAEAERAKIAAIGAELAAWQTAQEEERLAKNASHSAEVKKAQRKSQAERYATAQLFGKTSAKTLEEFLEQEAQTDRVEATRAAIRSWKTLS